eukprot:13622601-Alexandrium_andersonii.AAC.1
MSGCGPGWCRHSSVGASPSCPRTGRAPEEDRPWVCPAYAPWEEAVTRPPRPRSRPRRRPPSAAAGR